jgi:3-hydroxybutyryl-CoA dehydrogenase
MSASDGYEKVAIAGSGTIACGLAACATSVTPTVLLARSDASASRAEQQARELCGEVDGADAGRLRVTTTIEDVGDAGLVVEAIVEDLEAKGELLSELGNAGSDADLASTTSSLSIVALAERSSHGERVFGLHVFNPVTKMKLIELCLPADGQGEIRKRARAWCAALDKTPIEVPDQTGFVVNRLLFPYLFDAVRLVERTGMSAEDVDECMTLGAGYPMGPLALLDMVGVDVAVAIGEALHADSGDAAHEPPGLLVQMVGSGKLGRKSGAGFFDYAD